MVSLNKLFGFVLTFSNKYRIDTSHSELHSMAVLHFADENLKSQVGENPLLLKQQNIIYSSAILHDMCDKKYVDFSTGIREIEKVLNTELKPKEIKWTKRIIETMSYSTVKKNGFPDFGKYQNAYHIVREADLLTSFDFDRTMIYHMNRNNSLTQSYKNALELFDSRVFNYHKDQLLLSDYSKEKSVELTNSALKRMIAWNNIIQSNR
jgi:hypothetical protein